MSGTNAFTVGCCLTAGTFMPQQGGAPAAGAEAHVMLWDAAQDVLKLGYDFAELTVQSVMQLSEDDFLQLQAKLQDAGIRIPVFNSFIPASMRLTGPDVDWPAVRDFVQHAMKRVQALGGEIIVFGSGAARRLPDGFPKEEGLAQIRRFLALCAEHAPTYRLRIAIEPLNRNECNLINLVGQALELAEAMGDPSIHVLADAYHMHLEQEPFEAVARAAAAGRLAHVHYAEFDRSFPLGESPHGVQLPKLLEKLARFGYSGRISAECFVAGAEADRAESLRYVRRIAHRLTGGHE